MISRYFSFLGLIVLLTSCENNNNTDDPMLAQVYDKTLHLSDLTGMFPPQTSSEDSIAIIDIYTKRWTKDAVMMNAAEKHVTSDLDIEKLGDDYKQSLILYNYEKVLLEELDTTLSQEELTTYYENNKVQFELDNPIVRCLFVKVKRDEPALDKLRNWWNNKNIEALKKYCSRYATTSYLDQDAWYKVSEISAQMPTGTLTIDNVNSKKDFSQRDDDYQYYFSMLELVNSKETAPLSYISGQATKVILHDRKKQRLNEIKNRISKQEKKRRSAQE